MLDVLEVAQVLETERVAVSETNCLDGRDARMADDESLPLPRCRPQTEEMTHEHTVGSCVSDKSNLFARLLDVPHRELTFDSVDSAFCKEVRRTSMDTSNEVPNGLPSLEAVPPFDGAPSQLVPIRLDGYLRWRAVPCWFANFFQPRFDHLRTTLSRQQWRSGLTRTKKRRDIDVIQMLARQPLAQFFSLRKAPRRQGGVDDTEAVFDPFGFSVSNEQKFHARKTNPGLPKLMVLLAQPTHFAIVSMTNASY